MPRPGSSGWVSSTVTAAMPLPWSVPLKAKSIWTG